MVEQPGSISLQDAIDKVLNVREIDKHEMLDSISDFTAGCKIDSMYGLAVMLLLRVASIFSFATACIAHAYQRRPQLERSAHRFL
jgi:hypothetical protein